MKGRLLVNNLKNVNGNVKPTTITFIDIGLGLRCNNFHVSLSYILEICHCMTFIF